jgi:hypothetical protein
MLAIGLLAPAGSVDAQQPYFYSGVPDAQEYLDFLGGSGVNGGYGVQVGPYVGRFTDPTTPQFSIYCVDYTHYAKDQWVNVTALTSSDLSKTRIDDYGTYRQAAYLASLFDTAPKSAWGAIHAAIWNITSGQLLTPNDPSKVAAFVAQRDYYIDLDTPGEFTGSGWYILSPLNAQGGAYDGTGQEFLMRTVSVPEPASFILLASGLLFLAVASRRRLLGAGYAEGDA